MSKYDQMRRAVNSEIAGVREELLIQESIEQELLRLSNVAYYSGEIVTELDREFSEVTKLGQADVAFLFLAIALQCARQYLITPFQERMDADVADKKTKGKKKEHSDRSHQWYHPSITEVISNPVPFDAIRQSENMQGVLKGSGKFGHRLVLGHDPILGWIFGTGNIATSTITTWDLRSYHVKSASYSPTSNKKIDIISNNADTGKVLYYTKEKLLNQGEEGKAIIAASLVKEYIHLKSDLYSKRSLPFPAVSMLSPKIPNMLAEYGIDMANIATVAKQAAYAQTINLLIAMMHGLLFYTLQEQDANLDFHKVKTHKILSYSNLVASTSNVLAVSIGASVGAVTQNPEMTRKSLQYLDVGGILVTLYRLISDHKFIQQIKYEFLQNRWYEIVQQNHF